jgi:hypothetical protein
MCCLISVLLFFGPRAGIVVWYLLDRLRWAETFPNVIVPILGFLLLPWTTLAYVFVFPDGVAGLDYLWLALGVIADLAGAGGGFRERGRIRS